MTKYIDRSGDVLQEVDDGMDRKVYGILKPKPRAAGTILAWYIEQQWKYITKNLKNVKTNNA